MTKRWDLEFRVSRENGKVHLYCFVGMWWILVAGVGALLLSVLRYLGYLGGR